MCRICINNGSKTVILTLTVTVFSLAWGIVHLWLDEHILACKIEDYQIKNCFKPAIS